MTRRAGGYPNHSKRGYGEFKISLHDLLIRVNFGIDAISTNRSVSPSLIVITIEIVEVLLVAGEVLSLSDNVGSTTVNSIVDFTSPA